MPITSYVSPYETSGMPELNVLGKEINDQGTIQDI